jgi:polyisoprenyl-teichoic acid--peptidoglycan teichoic acid transferase
MTEKSKDKNTMPTGAAERRRGRLTRTALLSALLIASFVIAFGYAALAVYQWAHTAALTLPGSRQVSPPSIVLPAPAQPEVPDVAPSFGLQPAILQATDPEQLPVAPQAAASKRITFLLLGVDQRPDDPSPLRTDTMIVVTVQPETNQVGMISLPRDLFVPIPGFDYSGKITTAFTVGELNKYPGGGAALAKKTVSEFLGYPIDYYVKINFDGFVQAIDAIGGVDVEVAKTIHDEEYPTIDYGYQTFHIDAGPQHLDGETALKYVRSRHGAGNDDFQRTKRQQQVLVAVKDKLIENKLLTPMRLLDLFRVVSNSVDHDIPATTLPNLLTLASRVEVDQIEQLVIDTRYAQIDANSRFGWILVPNREKIRPALDQIFAGQPAPAPALAEVDRQALAEQQARQQAAQARQQVLNDYQTQAEALRQQLSAEGARVGVYNGTGDPMLTARAADWLQRQGYMVVEAKDADRSDYPRTALITYSEKPVAVEGLKDMFAIAPNNIQPGANGAETALDLRLIIGRDFYLLVSN